jgi:Fe-S-cluster containining protein
MTDDSLRERVRKAQYDLTINLLGKGAQADQLLTLVDNTRIFTLQLIQAIEQQAAPLACQAGCHFCCYLMATVSAPEALAIVRRLEETYPQPELEALKNRVAQAFQQTRALDNLGRIRARIPCPFLAEDGTCVIYAYRPLDCVTYHSLSRQACEDLLMQPEQGHPVNPSLQAISLGLKTGLGQGIATAGLERPALRYELIEAIHIGLNDSQVLQKYLSGQNLFEPAAIVIDSDQGICYKIKSAPPRLRAEARKVIAAERRAARSTRK